MLFISLSCFLLFPSSCVEISLAVTLEGNKSQTLSLQRRAARVKSAVYSFYYLMYRKLCSTIKYYGAIKVSQV